MAHVLDGDRHGSDTVVPLEGGIMNDAGHDVGEEYI